MEAFLSGEADVNLAWVHKVLGDEFLHELLGRLESQGYIGIVDVHPEDVHVELPSVALYGAVDGKVIPDGLPILKQGGIAFMVARLVTDVFEVNNPSVLIAALYRAVDKFCVHVVVVSCKDNQYSLVQAVKSETTLVSSTFSFLPRRRTSSNCSQ